MSRPCDALVSTASFKFPYTYRSGGPDRGSCLVFGLLLSHGRYRHARCSVLRRQSSRRVDARLVRPRALLVDPNRPQDSFTVPDIHVYKHSNRCPYFCQLLHQRHCSSQCTGNEGLAGRNREAIIRSRCTHARNSVSCSKALARSFKYLASLDRLL